ncbi:MAG: sulfatase [Planctomycetes bacterium]|nr:sulfatase [Planctomycetota bacterium]
MKNRDFLNLTHLACAIGALVVGTQAQTADTNVRTAAKKRPNILFIFSDDHAPHAIGAYGSRFAQLDPTPAIDGLARQGMLFRRSYCTNSICGPSRAVVLTGMHSHKNGFRKNGDRFDGSQTTFPKLLRSAGYETALFGKWHLGSDPEGFDTWRILPGQGAYYNPVFIDDTENADGKHGRSVIEGHCTDIVTDLATRWIDERKGDKPWLLMCQHKAPHRNWMPAPRHLDLWKDIDIPEPPTLFDDHADDASPARLQEMTLAHHLNLVYDLFVPPWQSWDPRAGVALDSSGFRNLDRMTKAQRSVWDAAFDVRNRSFFESKLEGDALVRWKYQSYIKNYLRAARGVDDSVASLLAKLEERGLTEDTIVVYSSDQGFFLGDHGYYDKRWMYEESLAMPLIIRWPGVTKPGSTAQAMVQNLDYAPTLLAAAGVDVPDDMQGKSLVPILEGHPPSDWRDAIYYHYHGFPDVHRVARHNGVRTDRFKLMHFYEFDEWELYDLEKDPDELHNVYGKSDYEDIAQGLKHRLRELAKECADGTDTSAKPSAWQSEWRAKLRSTAGTEHANR